MLILLGTVDRIPPKESNVPARLTDTSTATTNFLHPPSLSSTPIYLNSFYIVYSDQLLLSHKNVLYHSLSI